MVAEMGQGQLQLVQFVPFPTQTKTQQLRFQHLSLRAWRGEAALGRWSPMPEGCPLPRQGLGLGGSSVTPNTAMTQLAPLLGFRTDPETAGGAEGERHWLQTVPDTMPSWLARGQCWPQAELSARAAVPAEGNPTLAQPGRAGGTGQGGVVAAGGVQGVPGRTGVGVQVCRGTRTNGAQAQGRVTHGHLDRHTVSGCTDPLLPQPGQPHSCFGAPSALAHVRSK